MQVVELSTDEHIWDVRCLAIANHEELGGSREFDSAAVVGSGLECRAQKVRDGFNCWIAYDDAGEAVGYLAATRRQNFYSYRYIASQEMWYVLPKARGTRAAIMLVKAFEDWARSLDCEQIYMSVEHNVLDDDVAVITNIMNRLGYATRGTMNVKYIEKDTQ